MFVCWRTPHNRCKRPGSTSSPGVRDEEKGKGKEIERERGGDSEESDRVEV